MQLKSFHPLRVGLLLLAVTSSSFITAETNHYRWKNERGETMFSDRPPPKGVDYEVISSSSTFKRVVSSGEGAVPLETKPSANNKFDSVDSSQATPSTKNPELCERATMNLIALNSADKINVRNDQGEVKALSPQEREVARQTAEAQVSIYCD